MMKIKNTYGITLLTILRVVVGWHFLYEGIAKLVSPNWTAASYLIESKWLFSGVFHWMVNNHSVLQTVDFLNIWGLIFIGLGLFLGLFTRISSISGIALLLLYYVANPPFMPTRLPAEGHYYLINKNVIEAFILIFIATLGKDALWGIDRLVTGYMKKRRGKIFPDPDSHSFETSDNPRREFIKNIAVVPVIGGMLFGVAKKHGWLSFEEKNIADKLDASSGASMLSTEVSIKELKGPVQKGKIKNVEISRIINGGNLVAGFAHSRDLTYVSSLLQKYFTREKIIETLFLCEACGINTTIMCNKEHVVNLLKEYWRRGGKIQWIAQSYPTETDFDNLKMAIDNGAVGAFIQGGIADKQVKDNKIDVLARQIELIRSNKIIGGTACHSLNVPKALIQQGIEVDFFMKTFHTDQYWSAHPKENRHEYDEINYGMKMNHDTYYDNLFCINPEETAEFFRNTPIPWIGYKVLAAGAIPPKEAFQYVFENGVDFVCVGMFDFQVVENANVMHDTLQGINRQRKWYS